MPEITRRRTGEMLRELFALLIPMPEGMQAREALAALESRLTLSDYEKGYYASGGKRFDKIVRFATVDLVKAGWLVIHAVVDTVHRVILKANDLPTLERHPKSNTS